MSKPKCFKCEKTIRGVCFDNKAEKVWIMPDEALVFHGGGSFGSRIYDALINGIFVDILICDDCLRKHRELLRERKTKCSITD